MYLLRFFGFALMLSCLATAEGASPLVRFDARSARSGNWSDPATWVGKRLPRAGDKVQIRPGHVVRYDVNSDQPVRVLHVAGTLAFARDKSTRLDVGLLKIQPGDEAAEDGFNCHEAADPASIPSSSQRRHGENISNTPALEIGTPENPIPARFTAMIRLTYFEGMDTNTLPAVINCGGRWEVHGAPMNRTWVKLGATAKPHDLKVTLAEPVTGWKVGDRIIVTVSKESYDGGSSFRQSVRKPKQVQTEERIITGLDGLSLMLDQPLIYEHYGTGDSRSEVANLSRNVIIESANPNGVRGHTMYHRDSSGGISYAEFRHLGKEGLLGKYSIHFHLVRDTMRGSAVLGASIWDSHNRWITIHGTDYLVVRDCVGYQSVGHGFFLEDATEQFNLLDRNLAVQAYQGRRLPNQVLRFDPNDGAGFWWANGRNTFTRNVACENDEYGFRFEIAKRSGFDPMLNLRKPDGQVEPRDVRTIPFYRFEGNESHSEGLYSFYFGDDVPSSVHGDRGHPFIARNLRAWETHYALRPNLQFFLMDGLLVDQAAYGVYHPHYDAHVYRNLHFNKISSEPINRAHDDDSIQYGTFTYENLTLENCRVGRDPLIQLTCTAPTSGQAGHFRNLVLQNNSARQGKVVDLGGGPRNEKLQNGVAYYFHDFPEKSRVTKVVSTKFPEMMRDGDYQTVSDFTGKDVRAGQVKNVAFPALLEPIDDLPPVTMISSVQMVKNRWVVRGVSHDNGEIVSVSVNNRPAKINSSSAGVVDWEITLDSPRDRKLVAQAADQAGNSEKPGHRLELKIKK